MGWSYPRCEFFCRKVLNFGTYNGFSTEEPARIKIIGYIDCLDFEINEIKFYWSISVCVFVFVQTVAGRFLQKIPPPQPPLRTRVIGPLTCDTPRGLVFGVFDCGPTGWRFESTLCQSTLTFPQWSMTG